MLPKSEQEARDRRERELDWRIGREIERKDAEIKRLRTALLSPLTPSELKLIDKHCDWIAFGHAWNAVMKQRREHVVNEQTTQKEG